MYKSLSTCPSLHKIYISFAKEPCKRDDILQKRPKIFRSVLFIAAPYHNMSTHCNTLQHIATHSTHCNTLQHTAIHCNTLQHTATRITICQSLSTCVFPSPVWMYMDVSLSQSSVDVHGCVFPSPLWMYMDVSFPVLC